jgi:NADH dehydrogenase
MERTRPRVAIVGAGFAGLFAARELAGTEVDVVLVDRYNFHTFLPLLYQVATAALEPMEVAYPVRAIFRGSGNVDFAMAEVQGVDYENRLLRTDGADIPYDALILAPGSVTHFHGVPGAAEHSFRLKNLDHAVVLRNHILSCFEWASFTRDPLARKRLLTFVVAGGGPTGVELAGAMAELARGPLAKDFPALDFSQVRIVLLEAGDGLLPGFADRLRRYAAKRLAAMGVEVLTGAQAAAVGEEGVRLADGREIPTETVVWSAGIRGVPAAQGWGLSTAGNGRIEVGPTLQVPDRPEVFVAGDLSNVQHDGRPLPMTAPPAMQMGVQAARNARALLAGKALSPFAYRDMGGMATIGRSSAVAQFRGLALSGYPAWLLWLFVHLRHLIGFKNRFFVLVHWAVDYFLHEREVRLISRRNPPE